MKNRSQTTETSKDSSRNLRRPSEFLC